MLKLLRFVVRLGPKERQVNGNIRINVRDIDQRFMNDERNAQFFLAFAAEGLLPCFTRFDFAADKLPHQRAGFCRGALAEQKCVAPADFRGDDFEDGFGLCGHGAFLSVIAPASLFHPPYAG